MAHAKIRSTTAETANVEYRNGGQDPSEDEKDSWKAFIFLPWLLNTPIAREIKEKCVPERRKSCQVVEPSAKQPQLATIARFGSGTEARREDRHDTTYDSLV